MSRHAHLPATPARPPPAPALAPAKPHRDAVDDQLATVTHALPAPPLAARDIRDDDAARALLTRWLVHDLAPRLGLDPQLVRISTDADAAMRTEARGASGLSGAERIYLHPRRFRPAAVEGRYLLAHELVHAAQRTLPVRGQPARGDAEAEAHRLGHAFAIGHAVRRPQVALAQDALAADAEKVTPALGESVRASRAREIAQIKRFLSGWWISDGDVSNIMAILDSVAWPVARAILMALTPTERYALADNINAPHVKSYRRSVLAAYETLVTGQFDAVDLDVVRALDAGGMTTEEKDATSNLLRHLGDNARRKLLAEDRAHIGALILMPLPSTAERKRIADEEAKAAVDEASGAAKRQAILTHANDRPALDLLEQVRAQLAGNVDGAAAVAALDLLGGARADPTRLAYLGERLEQEGLVDLLLEWLPSNRYFDTRAHADTVTQLVQSRLAWKNARLVEDLLSYGLFDWAITDTEALFAYHIIKSLPLGEQLRFRRRDAGKWYLRLLDNLPPDAAGQRRPGLEIRKADTAEEIATLKAEGIAVEADTGLYNASERYARKLQQQGATTALQELLAAFRDRRKGFYTDEEAQELYTALVALGGASVATGAEHPADQVLREAVVRELDHLGYIDELFAELPESFLYDEANRVSTVKIMLARDPARVQHHAHELVSRGVTDWMVKDHEAWLAFMSIKALPDAEREDFSSAHPDDWARIMAQMSAAQRQSRDLNAYIGDRAGVDRASVLGQLAEADAWTAARVLTLSGLLHMAVAMTEHRFAFERSKEFKAVHTAGLEQLVAQYQLWDPAAGRNDYHPAMLQGTRWHDEGPFGTLKTIGNGLVTLWNMDVLYAGDKSGVRVDLADVQDLMGGDLNGVHLAAPAKKDKAHHPDANKLSVLLSDDGKSAELTLPELLIDTANVQLDGATFQTGAVALKDLRLQASYNAADLGQPTQAQVLLGSVVANDLLLASGSAMIACARLALRTLRIASGAIDSVTGARGARPKEGSIPFPLLLLLLLPHLLTLAVPLYLLYKQIRGDVEKMPKEIAPRTKALDFSFSSLVAEGVATSGGQQVERATITDVAVRVGLTRTTRLRAERASIDQRLARLQGQPTAAQASADLAARRKVVDDELANAAGEEQEYLAIQEKILAGGVTDAEQRDLQRRLNELRFDEQGSAYIDIGAIEASGVAGTVTAKEPIRFTGIHGEGGGNALADMVAMPAVTANELSRRSSAGERPAAPGSAGQPGSLHLDLGDVATGEIIVGGGLRTVASIDTRMKELQDQKDAPQIAPLFESLQLLRVKAARFELLVQHGVSSLGAGQLAEFRTLRRQLAAEADLIVKSIAITKLTLDVDVASGRVKMGAGAATIAGIQMPAQGVEIDQVIVRGLGVDALPAGGLLNWSDWKKNLQDADGKVDTLEVSGVRSRMHGLLFEKATLTGAYAGIKGRNEVTAGLGRLQLTGVGLVPRLGLLRRRLAGLREKQKLATGADLAKVTAEVTTLSAKVAELDQLAQARVAAYRRLQTARTPDETAAAKDAVAETDMTIIIGLAQYGAAAVDLDDFGVKVTGGGGLMGDALSGGIDKAARSGARISGAGPDGMLLRRLSVKGANTRADSTDASLEASGNMELGATRLDVHVQRSGDTATIDLAKLDIASFTLAELLLTTDDAGVGMQVGSTGASSITGVHLDGAVKLVKRAGVKGDGAFPADFRLAKATIRNFRIDKVTANGLLYRSIPDQIEASIKSGAIGGVWAQDVTLDYPADGGKPVILGAAGIDSITDLEIAGALAGGMALQRGRLNGRALRVDFLEEGALRASVGDLSATAMSLRGPDGWARFSLHHLSGAIGIKDGVYTLDQVKLGSLDVPAIHWRAGTRTIDGDKPARLVDLRVSAKVVTRKDKPGAGATEAKTVLDAVSVHDFRIGAVTAEHLVYRDGDDEVEIGAARSTLPHDMRAFRPLFISDIHVENLEWDPAKGVHGNKLEAGVGGFEGAAVYRNIKEGVRAGMALKGSNMGLSFIGPNFIVGNTGIIAKTAGFYRAKGIGTSFATGQIAGSYTLTDKGVIINGLDVDKITLGRTTYNAPGMEVELGGAGAERLAIGRVDVDFDKTPDAQGKPQTRLKEIRVDDITLTGLHADAFHYTGKASSVGPKGAVITKDTDLRATRAWIDRFRIETLRHDVAARLTTVARTAIDNRTGGRPAFGVQGLVAEVATTIGSKHSAIRFATDVEGSALTGRDMSFQTVKVGEQAVPGKPPQEITRSSIGGKFQLDRLALLHPGVTLTDAEGKQTVVKAAGAPGASRVVLTGFKPTLNPNGTMVLPFDALRAENFLIERGGMKVTLPLLQLKDFAMALKGGGSKAGYSLLAAKLRQFSVHDVTMEMTVDRSAPDKPKAPADPDADTTPSPPVFIEPLDSLNMTLSGEYDNMLVPEASMAVRNGQLNFEDLHPLAINLSDGHIAIGRFRALEINVKDIPMLPGMHPEQGKYGVIDLRPLAEFLVNDRTPSAPKPKDPGPPADLAWLNDIFVKGNIKIGNGRVGLDANASGRPDEGDTFAELDRETAADNVIDMPRARLGDEVNVNVHRLRARRLKIAGGADYPAGQTGEATVSGINVKVSGLANMAFTIKVTVKEGKIMDIQFGDVTLFNQDARGNYTGLDELNPPTAAEVSPIEPAKVAP